MRKGAMSKRFISVTLAMSLTIFGCMIIIPQQISANGSTFFVKGDYNGQNGISNGSESAPFTSIQDGLNAAHTAGAGSTVIVRGGVYNIQSTICIGRYGPWPYQNIANITLKAYSGEIPIIDGQNEYPPDAQGWEHSWGALVQLYGNNAALDGFEIRNSNGRGIELLSSAPNATIKNCNIHGSKKEGIFLSSADNFVISNCKVWENCTYDKSINRRGGGYPPGISCRNSSNGTIQSCEIYNNWGEGINCWYNTHDIIIQDNIVYDNYAVEIYLDRAWNITVQRNLAYGVQNSEYGRYLKQDGTYSPCNGIMIADEVDNLTPNSVPGHNRVIINNILKGNGSNITFWNAYTSDPAHGLVNTGLKNDIIANNTLVDGDIRGISINNSTYHENVTIKNNIIKQSNGALVSSIQGDAFDFSNNCWSSSVSGVASGDGDVIGNPGFVEGTYKLASDSICRSKGVNNTTDVPEDFGGFARPDPPCIGAYEYCDIQLLSNPGFDEGITSWLSIGGSSLSSEGSEVHLGRKSCKVTNRSYVWSSPVQDIKNALLEHGMGNYNLTVWVKLQSGTALARPVVKIADETGSNYIGPTISAVSSSGWTKLSWNGNISWTGTVSTALFYIDNNNPTVDMYIDSCSLTRNEILKNQGFEELENVNTIKNWSGTPETQFYHSGTKSSKRTNRTSYWNGPSQNIKSTLLQKGQGAYKITAWVKLASGTGGAGPLIKITDGTGDHYFGTTNVSCNTGWTECSWTGNVTWTGTISQAILYSSTNSTLVDIYVDDCSLIKQ